MRNWTSLCNSAAHNSIEVVRAPRMLCVLLTNENANENAIASKWLERNEGEAYETKLAPLALPLLLVSTLALPGSIQLNLAQIDSTRS